MYVPSVLMTIVPLVGPDTGVVVTTNGVPSGSMSPASVKSPPTVGFSSDVVLVSLSTIGASLTGVTVMVKVWLTQIFGNGLPESHTSTVMTSVPLKYGFGV